MRVMILTNEKSLIHCMKKMRESFLVKNSTNLVKIGDPQAWKKLSNESFNLVVSDNEQFLLQKEIKQYNYQFRTSQKQNFILTDECNCIN